MASNTVEEMFSQPASVNIGGLPQVDFSWVDGVVHFLSTLLFYLLIIALIAGLIYLVRYVLPVKLGRVVLWTKPGFIYYLTSGQVVKEPNQWILQDGKEIPNPKYEGDAVGWVGEGTVDQVLFWSPDFELDGRLIVPKKKSDLVADSNAEKAMNFFLAPVRGMRWIGFWKKRMPVANRWDQWETTYGENGNATTKIVHKSKIEWAAPGFVTKFAIIVVEAEDLSGRRINLTGNLLIRITDPEKARFSNPDGNRQTVDAAIEAINACIKTLPVFDNLRNKVPGDWLGESINSYFQTFNKQYVVIKSDGSPESKEMPLRQWCHEVCGYDIAGFIYSSVAMSNPADAELLVAKVTQTITGEANEEKARKESDTIIAGLPGRQKEAELIANNPQVILAEMFKRGTSGPGGQPAAGSSTDKAMETFGMMMQLFLAEKLGMDITGMFAKKKPGESEPKVEQGKEEEKKEKKENSDNM